MNIDRCVARLKDNNSIKLKKIQKMNYKLEANWGDNFHQVAEKAKAMAAVVQDIIEFEFNGVTCLVAENSNPDFIWRYYNDAHLMEWKTIGPNYKAAYDSETQIELDKRKKKSEERQRKQEQEWAEKDKKERAVFQEKTKGIEIELADAGKWNEFKESNKDPYGGCCVEYAEGWAKLMQAEFANGKKIADCAEFTSHELGFLGITGFMYGCAVSMLASCWKHGEALRMWHNLKTQIRNEGEKANESGGVLNPALLSLG